MTRTLHERFVYAESFRKPTVLIMDPLLSGPYLNRPRPRTFCVVGPGHKWLGCEHATFEDAIKEANDGHRK